MQSKATEGVWRTENDQTFLWRADPEHIEYWTGSNQPVILVCSRPKTGEAYWRNVQEWASDPARRASGLVDFDKTRDGAWRVANLTVLKKPQMNQAGR